MFSDLTDKKIIITGSSRGIGAGIAKYLANQGAQIAITYSSSASAAEKLLSELKNDKHLCVKLNVSNEDSVKTAMSEIFEKFGKIDALVNNAGVTQDQILLRMKNNDFDSVINTNLRGTYLCTKAVLKPMIKQRAGSIVNITSVIGQTGNAGQANYAASKAGIEAFSKSIAQEVGSRGIRINCVAPGFIVTDMTDELNDDQKQHILKSVPLQRMGDIDDVAAAVAYLLSSASSYMTGQTLSVNGGLNM